MAFIFWLKSHRRFSRFGSSKARSLHTPFACSRLAEGSKTSADELALTSTSFSYHVEEPETSADEPVFTSFSHPVEDEGSADELSLTTDTKPTTSTKRLGTRSKKTISKDRRSRSNASRRRLQSKDSNIKKTMGGMT
jgi:hypothetical protein